MCRVKNTKGIVNWMVEHWWNCQKAWHDPGVTRAKNEKALHKAYVRAFWSSLNPVMSSL